MERKKKGAKVVKKIERKEENKCNNLSRTLIIISVLLVVNILATILIVVHLCGYERDARYSNIETYYAISRLNRGTLENDPKWATVLAEKTTLSFDFPEEWFVAHTYAEYCKNREYFCGDEKYEIIFNNVTEESFNEFTEELRLRLKELDANNIVQSFKESTGYYEIASFDEAAFGNMYFDEMPRGSSATPRHKVKLQYDAENHLAILQVDVY